MAKGFKEMLASIEEVVAESDCGFITREELVQIDSFMLKTFGKKRTHPRIFDAIHDAITRGRKRQRTRSLKPLDS